MKSKVTFVLVNGLIRWIDSSCTSSSYIWCIFMSVRQIIIIQIVMPFIMTRVIRVIPVFRVIWWDLEWNRVWRSNSKLVYYGFWTLSRQDLDKKIMNVKHVFAWVSFAILLPPQFYIQLVYKPQFGTWILLFGPFGQLRAVRKKKWIWVFLSNFWGCFFQILWENFLLGSK